MKKYILFLIPLLFINTLYSQVLYEETFDNYNLGSFNSGTGNWNRVGFAEIIQEPNRGNVLVIKVDKEGVSTLWQNVGQIWGNRTAGNNILLAEYDVYYEDFLNNSNVKQHNSELYLYGVGGYLLRAFFSRGYGYGGSAMARSNIEFIFAHNGNNKNYNNINFTKSWFTVKFYIDYDTNKKYFHIPALNIVGEDPMGTTNSISAIDRINFLSRIIATNTTGYTGVVSKYDNIRITALKTLPQELIDALLSTDNFLAEKFNLYPNPATNVVTITNNENRLVNQVSIYDTTGKLINTQSFNNKTEIQLNVESLASGAYLLHLQTAEGTAVKKLVKK